MASLLKKARLYLGLILVQVLFAGYQILSQVVVNDGLDFLVFSFYRNVAAVAVLVPAAVAFERNRRPPLTLKLLAQFCVLAFTGLFATQALFLAGVGNTSAALGAAMSNSVPVFTFIVAVASGVDQVRLTSWDGAAKVAGTIFCMAGAVTMCLYQGSVVIVGESSQAVDLLSATSSKTWQLGTVLLLSSSVAWATYIALQALVQASYPAPITILAFTYFFGALQFGAAAGFTHRSISAWSLPSGFQLTAVLYSGVVASAFNYTLHAWCINEGGPVLAAAFSPLQALITLLLAVELLGDPLFLGSLIGGLFIFLGLCLVTCRRIERDMDILSLGADGDLADDAVRLPLLSES